MSVRPVFEHPLTPQQRRELAAWYWQAIDNAWAEHVTEHPDDTCGGERVQDLIEAAITEGLMGQQVDVGDGQRVQLSTLVAPLRTRPGGYAETTAARNRQVLDGAMARRRVWWR